MSFSFLSVKSKIWKRHKNTIAIITTHSNENNAFRVREPPAGPKNMSYISPDGTFLKNFVKFANLDPSRSRATEFSWTSRFQNHNLHGLHALLKWICPAVVPIKCFSSTEKAISVSTSHMVFSWRANAPFRVREPPAGPKKLVHFANPYTARSRAIEFSQTSRLQNLNLHTKSFRLEASQRNLTTGPRDIAIFVKIFFENPQATFATICPACCSRKVLLFDGESNLRLY